jgi:Flp pilus assembly protein TadB
MWPDSADSRRGENALAVIESRLAEIDGLIEEAESESESLRSREQSAPLQGGCAFFGLFMMIIFVIALFMLVGKGYVGSWLFYASVAVVILLSLARIRRKLVSSAQLEKLRQDRVQIEEGLAQLQAERDRIQDLGANLSPREPNN